MGRRSKNKQQQNGGQTDANNDEEHFPATVLLALHPGGTITAIAAKKSVRVWDSSTSTSITLRLTADSQPYTNTHIVRCLNFSHNGAYLLTAGDDKRLRLWDTTTWTCKACYVMPKKISSACFTLDDTLVLIADRFGDVRVASTAVTVDPANPVQPNFAFGHWNGFVTTAQALALPPPTPPPPPSAAAAATAAAATAAPPPHRVKEGILTTDRDGKVRITGMTPDPLTRGLPLIHALGLGHTSFVMTSTIVHTPSKGPLVISGGGDGTVRVWNPSGVVPALCTLSLVQYGQSSQQEEGGGDGQRMEEQEGGGNTGDEEEEEEEDAGGAQASQDTQQQQPQEEGDGDKAPPPVPTVLSLSAHPTLPLIAAAVEGCPSILLLQLDTSTDTSNNNTSNNNTSNNSTPASNAEQKVTLTVVHHFECAGVPLPCLVRFDADARLWIAAGPFLEDSVLLTVAASPDNTAQGYTAAVEPDNALRKVFGALQGPGGPEALSQQGKQMQLVSSMLRKRRLMSRGSMADTYRNTKRYRTNDAAEKKEEGGAEKKEEGGAEKKEEGA